MSETLTGICNELDFVKKPLVISLKPCSLALKITQLKSRGRSFESQTSANPFFQKRTVKDENLTETTIMNISGNCYLGSSNWVYPE